MPNITYSLGGTSFDAVPENMDDVRDLPTFSEATLGRGRVHSVGVELEKISLKGKFMSASVKTAIDTLIDSSGSTGTTAVFNDGYSDRNVLIEKFVTYPLVGKTEGFSFRLELVVAG